MDDLDQGEPQRALQAMSSGDSFTAAVTIIPATGVKSLVWREGKLMDWVSGDVEYALDGIKRGPTVFYPYRFDAAIASPSGKLVALFERLGTKAVIIGSDGLFREINRSYYHADVYEYPILLFRLPDGREALAHCPEEYCDLCVEDPASGARWSEPGTGRIESMFHSRLNANLTGTRILSAGWFWHPFNTVSVFDLVPASNERMALAACDKCCDQSSEIASATFNQAGLLIAASAKTAEGFNKDEPGEGLRPGTIGVYDLDRQKLTSLAPLEDEVGTLIPVGKRFVIGLYEHPKLIEVETGRVLHRWPELKTGKQNSSIVWNESFPPPVAYDAESGRLAVADDNQIVVLSLAAELLQ